MSSISFPHHSGRPEDSHHEDQYYTPSFDTSSFQINPLSSHPPRTPRTSVYASSSHHYSSSVYEEKKPEAEQKLVVDVEDIEIDLEEERVQTLEKRVRREEVWREMFLSSNGRDKAFVRVAPIARALNAYVLCPTRNLCNTPSGSGLHSTLH